MTTTVRTPSVEELTTERQTLLEAVHVPEAELRARAADYLVTREEARIVRRLDTIDYLLGSE